MIHEHFETQRPNLESQVTESSNSAPLDDGIDTTKGPTEQRTFLQMAFDTAEGIHSAGDL
jgi:hypothetical protein